MEKQNNNDNVGSDRPKKNRESRLSAFCSLFLFPLLFLYDEGLFKLFGGISPGNAPALFLLVLAAGGLAQTIYLLLPGRKSRSCYSLILATVVAVLFITECFTGRAFQSFMTFESLFTGAGDAAGDFGGTIFLTVLKGWYVILAYLLPVFLLYLFRKRMVLPGGIRVRACGLVLTMSLGFFALGNRLALSHPVYSDNYQFDLAVRTFGLMTSLRLETAHGLRGDADSSQFEADGGQKAANASGSQETESRFQGSDHTESGSSLEQKEPASAAVQPVTYGKNSLNLDFSAIAAKSKKEAVRNLSAYLSTQEVSSQNEFTGLFKGKNLILICAEAFSPHAVTKERMPALYRLLHQGFYFSDYYQPAWGGSTSTGEYSLLTGLIPTSGVKSIRKTEGHNLRFSIGNQLKNQGYYSAAFHNNSYTYYGRNKTHTNFGYETFMGMGNGMEAGVKKCWPESDREMMDYTVPLYLEKQPFSVYYMTVSGHCGYSWSSNAMSQKNKEAVQDISASKTIKAYLASQLELEYAMESLLAQLEEAGIADNTVICLTSDHYPYGLEAGDTWENDRNYLPELYGCRESEFNKFVQDQNGLIIWSGCLETSQRDKARTIAEPVYSLDILPTLSNLFGVEYDSRLFAGRDVFSDASPLVIWPDYSWKTDLATYNAVTGKLQVTEGKTLPEGYVASVKKLVKNKMNLSKITLDEDYWNLCDSQDLP